MKRLLSDNAWTYRHNRSLRELLTKREIRHLFIRPRRPQTNGKVERYQQTLKREWALGQTYRSSDHRAQALSHWLRYYNQRRPHSSLGGRPPISRVHNVPRQDDERSPRTAEPRDERRDRPTARAPTQRSPLHRALRRLSTTPTTAYNRLATRRHLPTRDSSARPPVSVQRLAMHGR